MLIILEWIRVSSRGVKSLRTVKNGHLRIFIEFIQAEGFERRGVRVDRELGVFRKVAVALRSFPLL